jgi:hypothetical protein
LEAEGKELGHRDHVEGVARQRVRPLLRGGLKERLPEGQVRQVKGVADAEEEEQPSGTAQARAQRQRRAGQAGHEPRREQEAGRGGAVEDELELVEGRRPRRRREHGVGEVALDHDQGHQPPEGVDVELAPDTGARAALRPRPLLQTIRL